MRKFLLGFLFLVLYTGIGAADGQAKLYAEAIETEGESVDLALPPPDATSAPSKVSKKQLRQQQLNSAEYYPHFDDNPLLPVQVKRIIRPYLLPLEHDVKPILDKLFARNSSIENASYLRAMGFSIVSKNTSSHLLVVRHPQLPGFLLKIHPRSERRKREGEAPWRGFVTRCRIADKIQDLIERKQLRHFKVPNKWIYPLPAEHAAAHRKGRKRQAVILVVEDMHLLSKAASRYAWKNLTDASHLRELFCILSHGYATTCLAENIPRSVDGKFACIDTEFKPKIELNRVCKYIPSRLWGYWKLLSKKRHRHVTS